MILVKQSLNIPYELNYGRHWHVDFETGFIYINNKKTIIYDYNRNPLFNKDGFNTINIIRDSDIYDLIFEGYIFKKDLNNE